MAQLNVRIPAVLAEEIDDTWEARGFPSKTEFVRQALRAAVGPVASPTSPCGSTPVPG